MTLRVTLGLFFGAAFLLITGCGSSCNSGSSQYSTDPSCPNYRGASSMSQYSNGGQYGNYGYGASNGYGNYGGGTVSCYDPNSGQTWTSNTGSCSSGGGGGGGYYNQSTGTCVIPSTGQQYYPQNGQC